MEVIKKLYQDDEYNAVYLCKNNRIKICIAGRCISKPIESWVTDDATYTNRVLLKRINELESEIN